MIIGSIPGAKPASSQAKKKELKSQETKRNQDDFDPNDHRLFIGNLDRNVTDAQLHQAFSHYPSLLKVRIVVDKRTGTSKGYGFVSLRDSEDARKALKEMQAKYVGPKPIKVIRSKNKYINNNNKRHNFQISKICIF